MKRVLLCSILCFLLGHQAFADLLLDGSSSGAVTLKAAAAAGTPTFQFPTNNGTNGYVLHTDGSGVTSWSPGGSGGATLTFGAHLTGTSYDGSVPITLATDAASANTASTIVARDGSGNFTAGTITASLTGHASLDAALSSATMSGLFTTAASASGGAGLNLPQGAAPTSPVNGDLWTTSSGIFVRIAGSTVGPLGTGGGSVSVTASTANIVVNPSPGTGTFTIGTTNLQNPQSGSSYTVVSGDLTKQILRTAAGAQTDTVPQATGSFTAGAEFALQTKTNGDTITPTTSTVNGLASIKLGAYQFSDWASDGTNWFAALGVPQPATQTGTTFLRDDMTWQTPVTAASSITPGTTTVIGSTAPCLIENSTSTTMACPPVGTNVITALGNNLSAAGGLSTTIASGTSALGTSAIGSAACATVVTTTATNIATTDVIWWGFNGDPTAVTGYVPLVAGMLTIIAYPSANNVNFKVCNNTSSSVTPGAITLNWRVIR